MTSGKNAMIDLGEYNYTWPSVMIGVIGHVIVLVVGYFASFLFPPETNLKKEWTFWGWLETRKSLHAEKSISPAAMEANA